MLTIVRFRPRADNAPAVDLRRSSRVQLRLPLDDLDQTTAHLELLQQTIQKSLASCKRARRLKDPDRALVLVRHDMKRANRMMNSLRRRVSEAS